MVTDVDLSNHAFWQPSKQGRSQAAFYIHRGLTQLGVETVLVGPNASPLRGRPLLRQWVKIKARSYQLRGKAYILQSEPAVVERASKRISRRLAELDHDIVLVLGDALPIGISGLGTKRPIAYCHDAPMVGLLGFYPNPAFAYPSRESRENFLAFEQAALRRCKLVMYACAWSANKAIEGYGLDPATVEVVPWGANLDTAPAAEDVERMIASRPAAPCRLVFFGVEWQRKGGDIALEVACELNRRGIPTELTIIGCDPPIEGPLPPFVDPRGYVDKFTPEGHAAIAATLARSHFLILPTRADVFAHVLAEGNAFGVPCVAPDVGGIATVVVDGVNGGLMKGGAGPLPYADFIARTMADPAAYQALARSSRRRFEERLCWDVAVRDMKALLERVVAAAPRGE